MTTPALAIAALLVLSAAFTVLVATPAIEGCRSFDGSASLGPLTAGGGGRCDAYVTCENLIADHCE